MTLQGSYLPQTPGFVPAQPLPRFAVVGRGFSGLMTVIALLKTVKVPFYLEMFDPRPQVSGGQALSTSQTSQILNSRVRDLSVDNDDADDFNRWLSANPEFRGTVTAAIPGFQQIFVPKGVFSDYAYQRFSDALAARPDVTLRICYESASDIVRDGGSAYRVTTREGRSGTFDTVMIATGYGTGAPEEAPAPPDRSVRRRRLADCPHVVLLGSGVRVVDRLFQLRDEGFLAKVTIVSSSGFLPQSHTRLAADPVDLSAPMPETISAIMRQVREACIAAEAAGQSWQSVMNGLRKSARTWWKLLPAEQKRRFDRHLRAIYDSHRNRLPGGHHVRLMRELAAGNTILRKGIVGETTANSVMVRWSGQGVSERLAVSQVIDCRCSTPSLDLPPLRGLVEAGLADVDELGIGLKVEPSGRLLSRRSHGERLYAIGPLGLGSLPDIDLVPEIVNQAYAAAMEIGDLCFKGLSGT